jgi:hypothetical protein
MGDEKLGHAKICSQLRDYLEPRFLAACAAIWKYDYIP